MANRICSRRSGLGAGASRQRSCSSFVFGEIKAAARPTSSRSEGGGVSVEDDTAATCKFPTFVWRLYSACPAIGSEVQHRRSAISIVRAVSGRVGGKSRHRGGRGRFGMIWTKSLKVLRPQALAFFFVDLSLEETVRPERTCGRLRRHLAVRGSHNSPLSRKPDRRPQNRYACALRFPVLALCATANVRLLRETLDSQTESRAADRSRNCAGNPDPAFGLDAG